LGTPVDRPHPSTSTSSTSSTSTSISTPSATNSVTQGYTPHAMTYSPFNADSSCKSASQVLSDIAIIASKNVQSVRIYATECDMLRTVVAALKQYNMKLIQGFYMTSAGVDSIDSQVSDFITWLQEDSSNAALVELLVVGNEAVINVTSYPQISMLHTV
jgi:exo-beta-1,3-glucanase (GH17 family)